MTRSSDLAFTVLLPVHFRSTSACNLQSLRRALESVRDQQAAAESEILVIDDGSPTPVERYAHLLGSRALGVGWLRQPRSLGLVHVLNTGLRHAAYPLIALLNVNCRWRAGKIEKQLKLFAGDSDLTLTGTGAAHVNAKADSVGTNILPADWGALLRLCADGGRPFPSCSVVARASVFRMLGGYPRPRSAGLRPDQNLWSTWIRFFKPLVIEESLCECDEDIESDSLDAELSSGRIRELPAAEELPRALESLARALEVSLVEAGVVAYKLWHYGPTVRVPVEALNFLATILPDRDVVEAPRRECPVSLARLLGRQHPERDGVPVVARHICG